MSLAAMPHRRRRGVGRAARLGGVGSGVVLTIATAVACTSSTEPPRSGATTPAGAAAGARVLFVRGGPGTGGFLEGGADEQLSDVGDESTAPGNHGWGELAALLRADGFEVLQRIEDPASDDGPTPSWTGDLATFDVVVFGSNNADYDAEDAALVEDYVRDGGGVLFVSDANWGRDWPDAPASDQALLDPFDLVVNQDNGTYRIARDDFLVPDHPVLDGVEAFDGEGVSPFTVVDRLPTVTPLILAPASGDIRRPSDADGPGAAGPLTPAGRDDAALVVVEVGAGRVAGTFDRNTFFNRNGAGTSLDREGNRRLATTLFAWLAGRSAPPGTG